MQCPLCKETALVMTERQNIEIDYCPRCRGVWLDRGELDKIIERSEWESANVSPAQTAVAVPKAPAGYPQPCQNSYSESRFGRHGGHHSSHSGGHGAPHGSFLKRLFD
ncbi:TPA: zf-TFIIB domain-containing protein [Enterobacter cloacae]|uniref:TFIIB-type zinc ribbon-containing protein n=1 Tax=Enterobacter cloacae TaxID=550 RepID=UPI002758D6D6|nr:zf-TFIIB domain-containing protein [Enterobacter cloacae]HDT2260860.1 zf-TFIIB domain-containing protein [Enterobacter cloacae]HEC5277140.1 zf-TFIIB domain-containing protein [Enterobacter cloacae]